MVNAGEEYVGADSIRLDETMHDGGNIKQIRTVDYPGSNQSGSEDAGDTGIESERKPKAASLAKVVHRHPVLGKEKQKQTAQKGNETRETH